MKVFVYGSLKRGEGNHAVLGSARFVREATTEPRFTVVAQETYPAMIEGGTTAVHGEVFEIDEPMLAALDAFEGHPDYYRRITLALDDGSEAFAYVRNHADVAGRQPIISGRWSSRPR
jgi:gamma-glutamylaminecyclotransferase